VATTLVLCENKRSLQDHESSISGLWVAVRDWEVVPGGWASTFIQQHRYYDKKVNKILRKCRRPVFPIKFDDSYIQGGPKSKPLTRIITKSY